MKQTAVVVFPGRGAYGHKDLGKFRMHRGSRGSLIRRFDEQRRALSQILISELDNSENFSEEVHTTSQNASPLTYASSYLDYLSIDPDAFEIVAVMGNSLGWYTTLAAASAVCPTNGFKIVNTVGTLMQESGMGGQLIYPCVDMEWHVIPEEKERILDQIEQSKNIHDGFLQLSINFGGWAVLAGDEPGLKEFEKRVPSTAGFPRRLKNHSAFHSELLSHVAESAAELLDKSIFASSSIPMIDGRGHIWYPHCYENHELHDYTLSYQITNLYDFTRAIHVAALEFAPDVFITTGPGDSLRRAIAESLIMIKWRGMNSKDDFERADKKNRVVLHSSEMANAGDL